MIDPYLVIGVGSVMLAALWIVIWLDWRSERRPPPRHTAARKRA